VYGLQWGDPQINIKLRHIRDHFVLPYVHPDKTAVEIGAGGGRWTRYLLGFGQLVSVDLHQELLDELASSFRAPQLKLVKNSGTDFPGVADQSVDYIFTFGCFVHLELPSIGAYFDEFKRVLKPGGIAVVQYSDKTKELARRIGADFAETTPDTVRPEVIRRGFIVYEEDLTTLPHSSLIRFGV
jgi:cyclopropane fatty-acyl-phospholipid synthase-like methyltransferase